MANVTFTANLQPAPACYPPDTNALLTLIADGGLSGTIPDNSGGGIFVSTVAPPDPLTNKVWFKVDAAGRPLGVYMHYNGNWRRLYTGVVVGEIRMIWYNSGWFDGTGRGVLGGLADGWALCNGQNGTPSLQDGRFAAGGSWNGSAWVITDPTSGVSQSTGGESGHKLDGQDLPALTVNTYGVTGNYQCGSNCFNTFPAGATAGGNYIVDQPRVHDGTGYTTSYTNQEPLPLPNYFAMGYMMFVGYL